MMGKGRFIYQDYDPVILQTTQEFTSSSVNDGIVTYPVKAGLGSAAATVSGAYSGAEDRVYRVEIDSVGSGKELGQSTFRWKNLALAGWTATGVSTAAGTHALENNITIAFTAGAGNDFELYDRWDFAALCNHGLPQLIDRDRDTSFRTATLSDPEWIRRDFLTARQIRCCIIADHNITSAATVTLKAHTADSWTSPTYSQVLTWREDLIVYYLDQTYRYWRLDISDTGNPDGYIEIGNLFLGDYFEPTKNFLSKNYGLDHVANETAIRTDAGIRRLLLQSRQDDFRFAYRSLPEADITSFEALEASCHDEDDLTSRPFWFHADSADDGDTCSLVTMPSRLRKSAASYQKWDVDLQLTGVPRTVR